VNRSFPSDNRFKPEAAFALALDLAFAIAMITFRPFSLWSSLLSVFATAPTL